MPVTNPVIWGGVYRTRHGRWSNEQAGDFAVPVTRKDGSTWMLDTYEGGISHETGEHSAFSDDLLTLHDPEVGERVCRDALSTHFYRNAEQVDETDLGDDYELVCDTKDFRDFRHDDGDDNDYAPEDVCTIHLGYRSDVTLLKKTAHKSLTHQLAHETKRLGQATRFPQMPYEADTRITKLLELVLADPTTVSREVAAEAVEELEMTHVIEDMAREYQQRLEETLAPEREYVRHREYAIYQAIDLPETALSTVPGVTSYRDSDPWAFQPEFFFKQSEEEFLASPVKVLAISDAHHRSAFAMYAHCGAELVLLDWTDATHVQKWGFDATDANMKTVRNLVVTDDEVPYGLESYVDMSDATALTDRIRKAIHHD